MNYKNIYHINNLFYIKKRIYKKDINYGRFRRIEDAVRQRDLLVKHKWIKCASTGYPPEQCFPKYMLKKMDDGYVILNKRDGKTYGSYKSYKYAKIIKKILPFYEEDINIGQIEKIAHREYFKYIHYNDLLGVYSVKYKGITYISGADLSTILSERDLIVKYEGDEELICEYPTIVFDYSKDEIPEFFREISNITEKNNKKHEYQIEKQVRNEKIIIGSYPTYNLAILVRDYLKQKKWDESTLNRVIKVTSIIHKRDKYIHKRGCIYYIIHYENSKPRIYARYKNKKMAMYVRNKLVNNNWNPRMIQKFERKYYKESYEISYYYDNTDFFRAKT